MRPSIPIAGVLLMTPPPAMTLRPRSRQARTPPVKMRRGRRCAGSAPLRGAHGGRSSRPPTVRRAWAPRSGALPAMSFLQATPALPQHRGARPRSGGLPGGAV